MNLEFLQAVMVALGLMGIGGVMGYGVARTRTRPMPEWTPTPPPIWNSSSRTETWKVDIAPGFKLVRIEEPESTQTGGKE